MPDRENYLYPGQADKPQTFRNPENQKRRPLWRRYEEEMLDPKASIRKPRLINHKDAIRIGERIDSIVTHLLAQAICGPT